MNQSSNDMEEVMAEHPENYEDVTVYGLDEDMEEKLLLAHNECTFIWSNKEGWPVGCSPPRVRCASDWISPSPSSERC